MGITIPASFGTYPRILGHYVREMKLLTLEDAVHKATGMAARRMRLGARGLVRPGYAADLVIFNPERSDAPPIRELQRQRQQESTT